MKKLAKRLLKYLEIRSDLKMQICALEIEHDLLIDKNKHLRKTNQELYNEIIRKANILVKWSKEADGE